jgi:uncharacterized secreted protein with C-terminal beta-propeller domain
MVASFIVVIGLGLFLFWPTYNVRYDVADYADSQYQPLIEKIEPYRYQATKKPYANNFELGWMFARMIFRGLLMGGTDMAPGDVPEYEAMGDAYVESTDNQVAGIIEADIIKTTENYLFRLANNKILRIYSLEGENSKLVSEYYIPRIEGSYSIYDGAEMYLTEDCKTVIVITDYVSKIEGVSKRRVGITSIDVSDPVNPVKIGDLSIDGLYNTSRLVNGKILLVSEYNFNIRNVDYSNPETYVPRVTRNGEDSYLQMSEIYAPDGINSSRYSVVASVDIENFEISGVNGLLNFTNSVYVSENNLYITREYTREIQNDDGKATREVTSDIAVLGYTSGGMERQVITVSGSIKDQYSMDERDGHLRVVTSTDKFSVTNNQLISGPSPRWQSASLYVINLADGSLVASVEDFAPQGEEVASVRFDGDRLYVCTAVVITFTDPVFFFDLSDYSNITYTDTGVIDGFSSSLINLGEGFLLGIGEENWQYNKVEVYEEGAGAVNSVDVFKFRGEYSRDYKDYLVNREENLFGFEMAYDDQYGHSYVLLQFDGYKLNVISVIELGGQHSGYTYAFREFETRGILRDDILYIVTDECMVVVDTTIPMDEDKHDAQILTVVGIDRK